jgi:hypothetical protein
MTRAHGFATHLFVFGLLVMALGAPAGAATQAEALRGVDGSSVALADLRGQAVVLLFGGVLDPQSPDVLPMLQRLADRYASRGVAVYWVSLDPDKAGVSGTLPDADLAAYAVRYGFRGPVLRDPTGAVFRAVGSTGRRAQVPTIVILDQNGASAAPPMGGFDRESDMVNRIASVLDRLVSR